MQVVTTRVVGHLDRDVHDAEELRERFSALFAVAGSKTANAETVRNRLGLSTTAFRDLVDRLQRRYLVDVVSQLEGGSVVEYLSLTDEGASRLQQMMEKMCELPELE